MKEKTKQQVTKELETLREKIKQLEKIKIDCRQAEEQLRIKESAIASSINAIAIANLKGNLTYVNSSFLKMWGYRHEKEVLGRSAVDFWKSKDEAQQTVRVLHETGGWTGELTAVRGDGSTFVVHLSTSMVDGVVGKPTCIIASFVDISLRKLAEKRLETLNKELLRSNKRLKELILRDCQTGLYNHRYLEEFIETEFYRVKRHALPLSVIMLDIDYFKSINDVYGHQFGDLVLKQFARLLRRMVRLYDTVIRFGGEEFIIASSGADKSAALGLAQRLLDAMNLYNFGNKKHMVKLKLSVAVVSYPEDRVAKGMDLIELTDKILNKAKEDGGARVYSSVDIRKQKPSVLGEVEESSEVKSLKYKIEKLTTRTNQSLVEAVFAFAKTIKLKDNYTGEHVERIVYFATEIARASSLPKHEIERVRQASILHDLGKIGISDRILLKPSKLTKSEFEEIKKHPQIGADIIRPIHFLHGIIPSILYHHERWDSKGYPYGLKGEDIPLGARIVSIADVYQALISDRPYRKAYSEDRALEIIKDGSGTQFDPKVVRLLLRILR